MFEQNATRIQVLPAILDSWSSTICVENACGCFTTYYMLLPPKKPEIARKRQPFGFVSVLTGSLRETHGDV
jgi:hypothetical protein